MHKENRKTISRSLSSLLKKSLNTIEIQSIADKFGVHYNTIINIRDRRKKEPDIIIIKYMIKKSIWAQENRIKDNEERIKFLKQELEKLS